MVESVLVMLSPAFCDFGWCVAPAEITDRHIFTGRHIFKSNLLVSVACTARLLDYTVWKIKIKTMVNHNILHTKGQMSHEAKDRFGGRPSGSIALNLFVSCCFSSLKMNYQ